jgi:hypothetical protein
LLSDRQRLIIRQVAVGDAEQLATLYDSLDIDDRHRRFFSAYRPRPEDIERMTTVGQRGGARLVAIVLDEGGDEQQLVGDAAFTLLPNGDGELAITVTPAALRWLGPYLLDALAEAAAARGVPNLEADVLTTDHAMLAMLRSRGSATMEHTGWSVVRLLIGTATPTPSWPGPHDQRRVLVERAGGRWHAEHEARAAGLQVLTCSAPAATPCPAIAGQPCPLAAGADVIVVADPCDDERWKRLLESHESVHPVVPVCVERSPHGTASQCPPPASPVDGAAGVVAFVGRLANEGGLDPD